MLQLLTAKLPKGMLRARHIDVGVSGGDGALCDAPEEEAAPPLPASPGDAVAGALTELPVLPDLTLQLHVRLICRQDPTDATT